MPDDDTTATANGPEGQDNADDTEAQQALAAAAQEADGDGEDDSDDGLDDRTRAKIHKANREAQRLRERLKELEPQARELQKIKDGQKTEAQRLTDQLAERDKELAALKAESVRRQAADSVGLPAKFAKFITAADSDEALAQAKDLAKELGLDKNGQKRTPDLRQGARGQNTAGQKPNPDDLLRQMARR